MPVISWRTVPSVTSAERAAFFQDLEDPTPFMTHRRLLLVRTAVACLLLAPPAIAQRERGIVQVTIQTEIGNIELAVDSAHAPVSAANFLRYVDDGRYEGGRFHRTVTMANQPTNAVKIEVVQWAAAPRGVREAFPPIELERTSVTGLKHLDGTISMARAGPSSATSDVFICIGDQPSLDFGGARNADGQGFAAFGRVTKGMEIVRRIQASPARGQTLDPAVKILNIVREK
jgi:peptidyl-prolyl cis-trans isomerase A (cyclophilin A)